MCEVKQRENSDLQEMEDLDASFRAMDPSLHDSTDEENGADRPQNNKQIKFKKQNKVNSKGIGHRDKLSDTQSEHTSDAGSDARARDHNDSNGGGN